MTTTSSTLVGQVQCPSCSQSFRPENIRFIAEHVSLQGDAIAGPLEGLRFRASRFDLDGNAIDMEDRVCTRVACPTCHIEMPRGLLECGTSFVSIVGAPGSGKSCLLGAASWSLRKCAGEYGCSWVDVEPRLNALLHGYESGLFSGKGGASRKPLKTEISGGDWYHQIRVGSRIEISPKPMFFRIGRPGAASSIMVLYDNAGEHFQPVAENAEPPHTRHLGRAQALLFVFDPTMTPSADRSHRQELILIETIARIRRLAGVDQNSKLTIPLIVALTKADLWGPKVGIDLSKRPIAPSKHVDLDREAIKEVGVRAEAFISEQFPELIQSLGAFVDRVHWVPCSAFRTSANAGTGIEEVQAESQWAEVPLLLAFDEASRKQRRK